MPSGRATIYLNIADPARSPRVYLLPILALALLLRFVMALAMAQGDPQIWFYNQASELGCLAHSVNTGHGLASPFCGVTGPSAFLAPGYPLLVALVFRVFGEFTPQSTAMLVALQIVFGLLIVLTLMSLTSKVFGSHAANIAGTMCAISPPMIWLPVLFWETSLSILFLTAGVALILHCVETPRRADWAAFGVLSAVAMLVNPALMLTLLALLAWAAWRGRRQSFSGPLLALGLWTVLFAAWPVRNLIVLHAFVPLRSNLGYELWQGNRPGGDGTFAPELHLNVNRIERARYVQTGEIAYMREKSAQAAAAIKADPAHFASLSLRRIARFWTGVTTGRNSALIFVGLLLSSTFAIVGLFLLARVRPALALLLALPFVFFPLPYYFTHADFRFRLLLDPIAMMLSTYSLQSLHRFGVKRRVHAGVAMTATIA